MKTVFSRTICRSYILLILTSILLGACGSSNSGSEDAAVRAALVGNGFTVTPSSGSEFYQVAFGEEQALITTFSTTSDGLVAALSKRTTLLSNLKETVVYRPSYRIDQYGGLGGDITFEFDQISSAISRVIFHVTFSKTPDSKVTFNAVTLRDSDGETIDSTFKQGFGVGGTVTGLTGTMTLKNELNSDELEVSQSGSFQFSLLMDDGVNYEVTVKTQPDGQICTVTNGSGTISAAPVKNITVACAVPAICGNDILEDAEACDDGNTSDGDCCDSTCQFESTGSSCDDNDACTPQSSCDGTGACVGSGSICGSAALGEACTNNNECTSGNCVDGVCCDTACSGTCQACSAAKKGSGNDGTCGDIASNNDPDNECTDEGASSCGDTGACDGAGACAKYSAGTVCRSSADLCDQDETCPGNGAACPADVFQQAGTACGDPAACIDGPSNSALIPAAQCSGNSAVCTQTPMSCNGYVCEDALSCKSSCATHSDCISDDYCSMGSCLPKVVSPGSCNQDAECQTGNCVGNICL